MKLRFSVAKPAFMLVGLTLLSYILIAIFALTEREHIKQVTIFKYIQNSKDLGEAGYNNEDGSWKASRYRFAHNWTLLTHDGRKIPNAPENRVSFSGGERSSRSATHDFGTGSYEEIAAFQSSNLWHPNALQNGTGSGEITSVKKSCNVHGFNTDFQNLQHLEYIAGCHRVVYNRVPKCGSRTVIATLKLLAKQNRFQFIGKEKPISRSNFFTNASQKTKMLEEFRTYESPFIYTQHLHFINFTSYGIGHVVFINVIRDPVERFISHYYYKLYGSANQSKNTSNPLLLSLDECMERNSSKCHKINELIPFFCGQEPRCRKREQWAVDTAKRNFEMHSLVVGLTSDLHAFMEVLQVLMPRFFQGATSLFESVEKRCQVLTQTAKKPEVSVQTRSKLKDLLRLEYEFYNFARQKFYGLLTKVRNLIGQQQEAIAQDVALLSEEELYLL